MMLIINTVPLRLSGEANAMGQKKHVVPGPNSGTEVSQARRDPTGWDRTSTPGPKQSLTSMGQKKTRCAGTEQRNRGLTSTPGPNWDRTSTPGPKQSRTSTLGS